MTKRTHPDPNPIRPDPASCSEHLTSPFHHHRPFFESRFWASKRINSEMMHFKEKKRERERVWGRFYKKVIIVEERSRASEVFVKMTQRERDREVFGVVRLERELWTGIYIRLASLSVFSFSFLNYLFYLLGMNWNLESILIGFLKLSSCVGGDI